MTSFDDLRTVILLMITETGLTLPDIMAMTPAELKWWADGLVDLRQAQAAVMKEHAI